MIKKYKKRPVTIEAIQFTGYNYQEIKDFAGDSYKLDKVNASIYIHTLEGDMRVSHTDYVIKGVKGEFYPCKADIFLETYERVDK